MDVNEFFGSLDGQQLLITGIGMYTDSAIGGIAADKMQLFCHTFAGVGTYPLNADNEAIYAQGSGDYSFYQCDSTHTGTLSINSFDSQARKLSGTFSFTGSSSTGTVNVTDGMLMEVGF